MTQEKPGLLKRIFSFGFGRSKEPEPEAQPEATPETITESPEITDAPEAVEAIEEVVPEPAPEAVTIPPPEQPAPTEAEAPKTPKEKPANKSTEVPTKTKAKKAETPAKKQIKAKPSVIDKPANKKSEAPPPAEVPSSEKVAPTRPEAPQPMPAPKAPSQKAEAKVPAAKPEPAKTAPETSRPEKSKAEKPQPPAEPAAPAKPSTPRPELLTDTGKVTLFEPRKAEERQAPEPEEARAGWFAKLRKGLSRSSSALTENIASVFTKRRLDDETLQELEDLLVQADLGVETAMAVTDALSDHRYGKDVDEEEVRRFMAAEIEKVLEPVARPLELDLAHKPHVILVVGVNGSGKTTTIGKMSSKLKSAGLSTLLVAGDTFRAAAIEQLKIWGERTGSPVVARDLGADAAGLAWDAWQQARDEGHDVMLMDTAGRLQNKTELMAELEKIIRVLKKHDPEAPHTVLLTLDATTGQNALNQVEIFGKVAGVNGLVMTKLDGTARGGILVAISARHKLPVFFLGVGEGVDDLEPFEAADFARSIAGLDRLEQATEQA